MKWEDREKFDSTNMKEFILKQGLAVKKTLKKQEQNTDLLAQIFSKVKNIVISGAGDKYLIPLISQYIWYKFGDKPLNVIHSRTLADHTPNFINKDTLCIFLSQSGKTKDTMDALKICMQKKAYCAGITNLREREQNSFYVLDEYDKGFILNTFSDPYPEKPLPSTQTFQSTLALLNTLLLKGALYSGADVEEYLKIQTIRIPKYIDKLSTSGKVIEWAKNLSLNLKQFFGSTFYVFGDGPRYGIARKQALIFFMEGVKNNASAMMTEEFLHSAVETLEKDNMSKNPMIMIMPPETSPSFALASKISSFWREHSFEDFVTEITPFEFVEQWPGESLDILSPALYGVQLSWFTYYYALLRGVDPGACHIVKKVRDKGF